MSSSGQLRFQHVSPEDWLISSTADALRTKSLLCSPSFNSIVSLILSSIVSVKFARQRCKGDQNYFRIVATIECSSFAVVDMFHNSSSGYRAQYFLSTELGDFANRYIVQKIGERLHSELISTPKRSCSSAWADASIQDPDAKVWIHQGRWLRYQSNADKLLHVDRWRTDHAKDQKSIKRARYSQLAPASEKYIDFKGGFVSLDGRSLGTLKPDRALHIHRNGFT